MIGEYVTCINKESHFWKGSLTIESHFWKESLTIDKEYEVLDVLDINKNYLILNDYGFEYVYPVELFKTKQDNREEKLKQLGIC